MGSGVKLVSRRAYYCIVSEVCDVGRTGIRYNVIAASAERWVSKYYLGHRVRERGMVTMIVKDRDC